MADTPHTILVTGGAGFIGSHSVDELIARGQRVVVLDNLSTGRTANLNPQATLIQDDLRTADLDALIKKHEITHVLHLAAQASVPFSVAHPLEDAQHNTIGTLRLLEACARAGVHKFVFASTGGAIYKADDEAMPYTETHATSPISPYAIAKETCEHYVQFFGSVRNLPWTILRYSNVYGPRQNSEGEAGVVAIFSTRLLKDEPAFITSDGKQTRDFVFVKDLARINADAVLQDARGVYNVSTGVETDINTLFALVALAAHKPIEPRYSEERPGEVRRSSLDPTKALKTFGWRATTELGDGVAATVASVAEFIKN